MQYSSCPVVRRAARYHMLRGTYWWSDDSSATCIKPIIIIHHHHYHHHHPHPQHLHHQHNHQCGEVPVLQSARRQDHGNSLHDVLQLVTVRGNEGTDLFTKSQLSFWVNRVFATATGS